jgi:nucleoside-triphosphatase THEP1
MGMTREEKEQTGKYVLKMARLLEDGCWQQKMLLNAVHIIDEVLDLESVVDKIRTELEEQAKINQNLNIDRARAICWCLDVIDKYKRESEKTI